MTDWPSDYRTVGLTGPRIIGTLPSQLFRCRLPKAVELTLACRSPNQWRKFIVDEDHDWYYYWYVILSGLSDLDDATNFHRRLHLRLSLQVKIFFATLLFVLVFIMSNTANFTDACAGSAAGKNIRPMHCTQQLHILSPRLNKCFYPNRK